MRPSGITLDGRFEEYWQSSVKAGRGMAMTTTYAFVEGGHGTNSTTGLVKSISQVGGNFAYTYDDNGNIVSVVQDGKKTAYTYDALGQLTQVDDQQENATWVYEYDQGGNILSKKKYAYGVTAGEPTESKTFTYGNANWKDQLTAVNGTPITYDAIGNPLSDGEWTYTWQNGRQLASMSKSGTTASFKYNENGLRVQKTVNGVVTDYTLHGKNIVHMKQGSNNLHFFYDAQNSPAVVVFNGTAYTYAKNLQGDIIAILDSAGTVVVRYAYDAWGRPISCTGTMAATLGKLNPFRYRGYVYDEETEMHYLCNRFYCAGICRFLNADALIQRGLLGCNMYAYCANHSINAMDSNGLFLTWIKNAWADTKEAFSKGCHWIADKATAAWEWTKNKADEVWQATVEWWDQARPVLMQTWKDFTKSVQDGLTNFVNGVCSFAKWAYDELIGIYTMGDLFENLAIDGAISAGIYFTSRATLLFGTPGFLLGLGISAITIFSTVGISADIAAQIDGKPVDSEHMLESALSETVAFGIGYAGLEEITEKEFTYIFKKVFQGLIIAIIKNRDIG